MVCPTNKTLKYSRLRGGLCSDGLICLDGSETKQGGEGGRRRGVRCEVENSDRAEQSDCEIVTTGLEREGERAIMFINHHQRTQ